MFAFPCLGENQNGGMYDTIRAHSLEATKLKVGGSTVERKGDTLCQDPPHVHVASAFHLALWGYFTSIRRKRRTLSGEIGVPIV